MADGIMTKAQLLDAMLESPREAIVGLETYAAFWVTKRGVAEGWNWRRIKREARKGTKSTYRGGWNAPNSSGPVGLAP